ncbi:MAG: hypothetical protein ACD_11C00112G0002 [uncultured bacterium]|nr:MAG: hypothetical protein ACD_11C00112G0002 [uncultured bacterium]
MKKIFLIFFQLILIFSLSAPVFAANFSQKNVTLPKDEIVNGDYFAGAGNVGAIFKTVAVLFGFGALLISERDYLLLLRSKKLV